MFAEHHESHAASAFFPSPFDEAAILTVDGVGEWGTTCFGVGRGNRIQLTHEIRFPHSLGLLYSAFTYFTGFRVNSGEYKLMGLAASVQAVTEEVMLRCARHVHYETGLKKLVLAGGVALNCVANGRLLREGPFENLWIQPAAGDAGGAPGTALFIWHQILEKPRQSEGKDSQQGSLLGPAFSHSQIREMLRSHGVHWTSCDSDEQLCRLVASLLAEQKVVGWFQGRMEFGPRALGSRSILGDARSATMQSAMNLKITFRESLRPFAPIVLCEHVHEVFEMRPGQESPYGTDGRSGSPSPAASVDDLFS